jgi:peptidoglycan/xylan/chitin deacetylase (PgdA/CDA1 family)
MNFRIRSFLRHAWVYALYYSGCLAWAKRQVIASGGIIGLTFHRVLTDEESRSSHSPAGMVVGIETFSALVDYVARKCIAVDLQDLGASAKEKNGKPRVAITFDDGWLDNAVQAVPILRRASLPCTIFLCSATMGKILPFWPERVTMDRKAAEDSGRLAEFAEIVIGALKTPLTQMELQSSPALVERMKSLPREQREGLLKELDAIANLTDLQAGSSCDATMSWEAACQLAGAGVRFGSHTVHHEILTRVPEAEARQEILESAGAIEDKLGQPCKFFAYPNGDWSPEVRNWVANAGYEFAFANKPGVWTQETNRWSVPRCNIWEGSVVSASGKFSSVHFDYIVFWKSVRASGNTRKALLSEGQAIQTPKTHL